MTKLTGLIFPTQCHLLKELETQGGTFCGNLLGFLLNQCWGDVRPSVLRSPRVIPMLLESPPTHMRVHTHTHTHANCEWQGPTAVFSLFTSVTWRF